MRTIHTIGCTLGLAAFLALPAAAQETRAEGTKLTEMTFSGPVQVPGVTLPAGTYTFQTPEVGDHVVQIFDKDRSKIFATVQTIPNDRLQATDQTVVMFSEQPAGVPQAVKVWFYPGNPVGEEFIYPKTQAMQIATAYHTTVLSSEDEKVAKGGKTIRVDERGEVGSANAKAVATSGTGNRTLDRSNTSNTSPAATTTAPGSAATTTADSGAASTTARAGRSDKASGGDTPVAATGALNTPQANQTSTSTATTAQNNASPSSSAQNNTSTPSTTQGNASTSTTTQGNASTSTTANATTTATPRNSQSRGNADRGATGTSGAEQSSSDTASRNTRSRLPQTASDLSSLALLSLFSIGAALGVRSLRRNRQAA